MRRRIVGLGALAGAAATLAGAAATLAGALAGCEARPLHVFSASRYHPVRDCLEPEAVIDVIDGEDPGRCDVVRCWASPAGEVYVTSSACDAPPGYVDRSPEAQDASCVSALDAFTRGARCDGEGSRGGDAM